MHARSRPLYGLALATATIGLLLAVGRVCLRPSVSLQPGWRAAPCGPRLARRVLLVVVDAMRADVFDSEPFAAMRAKYPDAVGGVVRTSPISMTTAGVRSMVTGTYPDLFDVLHNWGNIATPLPSVPAAAHRAGLVTATFGDSIWREMFPDDFVVAPRERHRPGFLYQLFAETIPDKDAMELFHTWSRGGGVADFTVLHLVGLDHAGHRNGVKSGRYAEIVRRTAAHLAAALADVPPNTTVVITADHGVTDSGGHGGASPRETDVPLFAFGPGLVPGARLSLHQIDLAPTLSCLLGLPIPEGSLGRPAVEALAESDTARTARLDAGLTGIRQS